MKEKRVFSLEPSPWMSGPWYVLFYTRPDEDSCRHISPQWASIEGDAQEWAAIAEGIRTRTTTSFKRVRVGFAAGGKALLCSPRNSMNDTILSLEESDALATEIDRVLALPWRDTYEDMGEDPIVDQEDEQP